METQSTNKRGNKTMSKIEIGDRVVMTKTIQKWGLTSLTGVVISIIPPKDYYGKRLRIRRDGQKSIETWAC